MVEWLAGNRIKGTSTERTSGTPEVPEVPAVSGGWKKLASSTSVVTSGNDSRITITGLANKKYYMVLVNTKGSNDVQTAIRIGFGGTISTSGYALNTQNNGGTNEVKYNQVHLNTPTSKGFINMFILNNSGNEKLFIYHLVDGASTGANNAPNRREYSGKWTTTSGQIDVVQLYGSGITFNADSVIKVWGHD